MRPAPTDQGKAPRPWGLIATAILGGGLLIASFGSLYRAVRRPAPPEATAPAAEVFAPDPGLSQEEIEQQYVIAHPQAARAAPAPVPPAALPTNPPDETLVLQKAKARVNQQLVERLKEFADRNPYRDNRELEKQIKIRETKSAPPP